MRACCGLALLCALCLVSGRAQAETYACRSASGELLFTSDPTRCPGAPVHEPRTRVQRVAPPRRRPSAAPAPPLEERAGLEEADAAFWREKKRQSQATLRALRQQLPEAERVVRLCNRGNDLYIEDEDGLRRPYSCERVRAEVATLRREVARLEAYLADGLEEECRRAGCLPGWIR